MWDSFENKGRTDPPGLIRLFDRAPSFDPVDADRFGIPFRPLFYCDEAGKSIGVDPGLAFSLVGTIHRDRYRILRPVPAGGRGRSPLLLLPFPPEPPRLLAFPFDSAGVLGTPPADSRFDPLPYPEVLRVPVFHGDHRHGAPAPAWADHADAGSPWLREEAGHDERTGPGLSVLLGGWDPYDGQA